MTKVPWGGDGDDGNQAFLLQDGMMKWDHKSLSHAELSSRQGLFFFDSSQTWQTTLYVPGCANAPYFSPGRSFLGPLPRFHRESDGVSLSAVVAHLRGLLTYVISGAVQRPMTAAGGKGSCMPPPPPYYHSVSAIPS